QPGDRLYLETSPVKLIARSDVDGFDVPLQQVDVYISLDENNQPKIFRAVRLVNTTGGAVAVVVAVGFGHVDKAPPSSLSLSGTVQIDDSPPVEVHDAGTESEVQAVKALLQNDEQLRAPLTTLAGATFAAV